MAIDEVDGRIYAIPHTSVTHRDSGDAPVVNAIELSAWMTNFVNSPKDSTCFLNAETVAWVCNQRRPTFGFRATDGRCVYAMNFEVGPPFAKGQLKPAGRRFVWPCSYHYHDEFFAHLKSHASTQTNESSMESTMAPVKKGGAFPVTAGFSAEQRPRPKHIVGAVPVLDAATELDEVERTFFLQAITGRFLFRDASESIENYVRHTRRKKETHPERLLFHSRMHHFKQQQRNRHCDEMKRKAVQDPTVRRDVKRIALQGMQFLESLNRQSLAPPNNTPICEQKRSTEACNSRRADFYALDDDVVRLITQFYVMKCFKDPDAKRAWTSLHALKLVNRNFNAYTCLAADSRLAEASNVLWQFCRSGTLPDRSMGHRVAELPWMSYKWFACSPHLLMNLWSIPTGQHKLYFDKRIATKLDQSVAIARAHARGARSPLTCDDDDAVNDDDKSVSPNASSSTAARMRSCASFEFCNPEHSLPTRVLELFHIAAGP